MKTNRYTNIRVLKKDAEFLKIVGSLSHESMIEAFHRLIQQEYDRLIPIKKDANMKDEGHDTHRA